MSEDREMSDPKESSHTKLMASGRPALANTYLKLLNIGGQQSVCIGSFTINPFSILNLFENAVTDLTA